MHKGNQTTARLSKQRRAGVLLHPTSLPGPLPSGDIGHEAYRFIEFLEANGLKVWQMLPLGPTHEDKSPYQCLSAHAGNPQLISLDWLEDRGWLDRASIAIAESDESYRLTCLKLAGSNFYLLNNDKHYKDIELFRKEHSEWLDDYALFVSLKKQYENKPWFLWPEDMRHRDKIAMDRARDKLSESIRQVVFEQYVFFTQWQELQSYARDHSVELFGDMPIFVAHDSADVWAQRENFLINNDGEMEFISGVPPDAFSDTGQRWGNPLYNWEYMRANDFDWWKSRFKTQLKLFEMMRIDHFRGLQACWQIPQSDDNAINGVWVDVPGKALLSSLHDAFTYLPLVAEDLGVITDDVIALKDAFELPGMKVLQFAFDGNNENPHLPHHHKPNDVVYTGTHDNDTTCGWFSHHENYNAEFLADYIDKKQISKEQGLVSMIRLAMSSVSFLCVLPMQDLLMLDSSARMNTPGTISDNWKWRFDWAQVKLSLLEQISHFRVLYQR